MKKKSKNIKKKIFDEYSKLSLEENGQLKSVYLFCKKTNIKESEFYEYFGSLNHVRDEIFSQFYKNTYELISNSKEFTTQSPKEKLLSFYFTFFEVLTLNRSYVLIELGEVGSNIQKLSILRGLKSLFKDFTTNLIEQGNALKKSNFAKHPSKIFSEGAWIQLLFLVRFWIEDRSPGFEKTDIAIEKSVRSVFDLFDNTPLDSIIDFGKFLWEEKIKTN
ncbi:MAG: TetR family transcriptional regulator C-terminal domain-containing protein [Flavobacteriaceae bacterium]